MSEILRVDNVSKEYRLGAFGSGTLREDMQSMFARLRGKEDPNSKIGTSEKHIQGDRLMALSGVSFSVREGERVGIIGRNGAGKSTILKLISGVTAPSKGTIYLNGRITSMLEVGTGFHKELTGRENVYLNGAILGMTKAEISQVFDDIVEFSEVGEFIDTPVKRYSSGMYVKLAFSVAAHLKSELVIMDEVLAVGDVNFQNKCIDKMNEVSRKEGRTILYVSHNMNTIRQLCKRCVVLEKGKLIYDGDTEEAIRRYIGSLKLSYNTCFDVRQNSRTENASGAISISTIELLGKEVNIFSTSETIKVRCKLSANKNYSKSRIMLIVFNKEGNRLGMSESNEFNIKQGDSDIVFEFSPSVLPDGDYYTELNVVERNSFGAYDKYEGVEEAFDFHIENETKLIAGQEWNASVWGNAFYAPIQIL